MLKTIQTCKSSVTGSATISADTENKVYCTHFVYNKKVKPGVVDALLAKKFEKYDSKATEIPRVKSRMVWSSRNTVCVKSPVDQIFDNRSDGPMGKLTLVEVTSTHKLAAKVISPSGVSVD